MTDSYSHAQLLERLRRDEDNFIERKTTAHESGVVEAVVGFANGVPIGREGTLFLGQRPDRTVLGVEGNLDKLQQSIRGWAEEKCFLPIRVRTEILDADNRSVVVVSVPGSPDRPHFSGPAYVRVGSQTIKATRDILDEMIASRNSKCAEPAKGGETVCGQQLVSDLQR